MIIQADGKPSATICTKLLKIGGRNRVSFPRVVISLAEAYPYRELVERVLENLRRQCPYPMQVEPTAGVLDSFSPRRLPSRLRR